MLSVRAVYVLRPLHLICEEEKTFSPSSPQSGLSFLFLLDRTQVRLRPLLYKCLAIARFTSAIRNTIGDAHGQGRLAIKPKPRHAELVVNLAGHHGVLSRIDLG